MYNILHVQYTKNIHKQYTCTIYMYNVRVQYTCTIYMCNIHVQYTCTIYRLSAPPFCFIIYQLE